MTNVPEQKAIKFLVAPQKEKLRSIRTFAYTLNCVGAVYVDCHELAHSILQDGEVVVILANNGCPERYLRKLKEKNATVILVQNDLEISQLLRDTASCLWEVNSIQKWGVFAPMTGIFYRQALSLCLNQGIKLSPQDLFSWSCLQANWTPTLNTSLDEYAEKFMQENLIPRQSQHAVRTFSKFMRHQTSFPFTDLTNVNFRIDTIQHGIHLSFGSIAAGKSLEDIQGCLAELQRLNLDNTFVQFNRDGSIDIAIVDVFSHQKTTCDAQNSNFFVVGIQNLIESLNDQRDESKLDNLDQTG